MSQGVPERAPSAFAVSVDAPGQVQGAFGVSVDAPDLVQGAFGVSQGVSGLAQGAFATTQDAPERAPKAAAQEQLSRFEGAPAGPERAGPASRQGRSLFRRLVNGDGGGGAVGGSAGGTVGGTGGGPPVAAAGLGAPTDIRLAPLGLPVALEEADDPGEPADQSGDPELDIDQDLDRAADPMRADERSRALELPGLGLPGADDLRAGYAADRDADMSGPFDAVDGTGAFSGLFADVALDDADETGLVPATETAAGGWAERTGLRYGDRVEGWIRPQYEDEPEAVAGEYWTPVPVGSYETEYGWPTPVERIPEVPPYPPVIGFDVPVEAEAEPTKPVPQWPPARPDDRIELPRSWSQRDKSGAGFRGAGGRDSPVTDLPADDAIPDPAADPSWTGRFADAVSDGVGDLSGSGRLAGAVSDGVGGVSGSGRLAGAVSDGTGNLSRSGRFADAVSDGVGGSSGSRSDRFGDAIPDPAADLSGTGRFADAVPDPVADSSRSGRFGIEPRYQEENPTGPEPHSERPADPPRDRRSRAIPPGGRPTGASGTNRVPSAGASGTNRVPSAGASGTNRVPSRRGPASGAVSGPGGPGTGRGGTYAAGEESLDGPIWTVPDLPEAAMPDLSWSPEEATDDSSPRRLRRPAVMIRRRRGSGSAGAPPADEATQALPPMELTHPDQRARPRPRPRPGNGQQEPRSTVYVSRHAAEPS